VAIALLMTLEELGQRAIPSRTFELADLGWSYVGVAIFGLFAMLRRRISMD